MPDIELNTHAHRLEARVAALEELLAAMERTVMEQFTERKRAAREQALLAALVESSEEGITSIAPDLRIMSWNRGAERLLGFTAEEALGRSIIDLYGRPNFATTPTP